MFVSGIQHFVIYLPKGSKLVVKKRLDPSIGFANLSELLRFV
jgi:hypothetical protein